MRTNALANETSPYLLQHAANPVDWLPWGEAAFAKARAENKPILLSIGYAACHWCHVMAHESFESDGVAKLMNERFVPVKVDREERPDLDAIYQNALSLLGQQGGWPLTMFLDADGHPFWGGTYFPPEPRHGRPSFSQVLTRIGELYATEPEKVAQNRAALSDALTQLSHARAGKSLDAAIPYRVAQRFAEAVDPDWGGVGSAPKFPNAPILRLLWRAWTQGGDEPARDATLLTLVRIVNGGIYDHLGGGFARYSTDAQWLVPHFEKMLYDNAQLLELLAFAWAGTGAGLFAQRAAETVAWLEREMRAEHGAFAATIDADSEGEEGRFYVWTAAEIDQALGEDAPLFRRAYDVTDEGNWEDGRSVLHLNHGPDLTDEEAQRLPALRARLLELRNKRERPGRDDKILGDWNGLMIAALAFAGDVFGRSAWIARAVEAFDGTLTALTDAQGRLAHSFRAGKRGARATLDDHVQLARAAITLFETTGEARFLGIARALVTELDAHYWDSESGGYFTTADDAERLVVRSKTAADSATPSGNGTALSVLTRLYGLTGDDSLRARAEALERAFAGEVERNVFTLGAYLDGVALSRRPLQLVVLGKADDPATQALADVARRAAVPDRMLLRLAPDAKLPASHPAHGKGLIDGKPAAYVCIGPTCLAPATDVETFLHRLAEAQAGAMA
ncbi:MAG: thymidylate kinase [Rhodospirillales bacterium]|nr:thymidylate kinase [Rhodospirillales bacterium]